jgi:hypothetical protein
VVVMDVRPAIEWLCSLFVLKGKETYYIFHGIDDTIWRFGNDRVLEWTFKPAFWKESSC